MMLIRPRRNRKSEAIRALLQETRLNKSDFIAPLFILEELNVRQPITSMPGVDRISWDLIAHEAKELYELGIPAVLLFPVIDQNKKDPQGTYALHADSGLCRAIESIKKTVPDLCIITDIALDPYTSHGHDGLVSADGKILNDETLEVLGKMALVHANAGADMVAPSDMMDGRIQYIRKLLDNNNFSDVNILAYTAKYASSLYGPFRDALSSTPSFGNKKTYQLNPCNIREALLEAELDEKEGADILMVKPALLFLDVIAKLKAHSSLPIAAYHVSGEYSMAIAAGMQGWLSTDEVLLESLHAIKRAGADIIVSYAAKTLVQKYL